MNKSDSDKVYLSEALPKDEAKRIQAVDAFRGLIIGLMFLVSSENPIYQLRHVHWFGFHLADLVYPWFLFILGVSLHLSIEAQKRKGISNAIINRRVLFRCLRLFALGLLLLSLSYSRLRFNLGTLQCLALATLIAFPVLKQDMRARVQIAAVVYLAVLFVMLCLRAPGDFGINPWAEGHTISEYLDRLILGKAKGEEGILSTLAAVPIVIFGGVAGEILSRETKKLFRCLLLGFCLVLIGAFLKAFGIPYSPRLLTPSYSALAAGLASFMLAFFILVDEKLNSELLFRPLVILGMNAIGAYVFVKLVQVFVLNSIIATGPDSQSIKMWIQAIAVMSFRSVAAGDLAIPFLKVSLAWIFCYLLYRKRIFLKL